MLFVRSTALSYLFWFHQTVSLVLWIAFPWFSCLVVSYNMPLYQGFVQLGAGLSVGLAGLAAGFAIGIVGDAGVRGTAQQPRLFVGMVCAQQLIFRTLLTWLCNRSSFSFLLRFWVSTVNCYIRLISASHWHFVGLIVALIMNGKARDAVGVVSSLVFTLYVIDWPSTEVWLSDNGWNI